MRCPRLFPAAVSHHRPCSSEYDRTLPEKVMDVGAIADSFWFVLFAYVAAFAPWTIISEKDFISEKWRTVKHTRKAAYHNLFWSGIPFLYVLAYCIIQGLAKDYKEACAAVIASLFALRHMFRTLWGLWQLHCFRSWAKNSILALKAMGIAYTLPGTRHKKQNKHVKHGPVALTAADVADRILVNEKIIDNQIMHGHLHSFISYGQIDVLTHADDKIHTLDPLYGAAQWLRIFFAFISNRFLALFGHSTNKSLKQVPLKPVEVWVHWAAAFAAQGLKDWLSEFDVVPDPDAQPYDHNLPAIDRLRQRGRYFSTQVLASASLHLWPDDEYGEGLGPFLWHAWAPDLHMSDGRVVKQELFETAIRSGKALPFGVPHLKDLEGSKEYDDILPYSYDVYRELLSEFITELPVKSIHVRQIREFDINKLEWLTILIYMGMLYRECKAKRKHLHKSSDSASSGSSSNDSSSSSSSSSDLTVQVHLEPPSINPDSDQAVDTLRAQLNIPIQKVSRNKPARTHLYTADNGLIRSSLPIGMNLISQPSEINRLVTRVGELIDVWMALVSGAQVSFLATELNEEWKTFCTAPEKIELCEIGQSVQEYGKRVQEVNYELEKRRLARRIADKNHKYEFLDQFVTFMGYRMESVRSSLARWANRNEGKSGDDFFNATRRTDFRKLKLQLQLSRAILAAPDGIQSSEALGRRCVQCRLIWELQNCLESLLLEMPLTHTEDDTYAATIMLFILSFPSLNVSIYTADERCNVEQTRSGKRCVQASLKMSETLENADDNQIYSQLTITPVCGPQTISILLTLRPQVECTIQVLADSEEFQWQWWRDAFLGRLEGFRDWQKELGISFINVDFIKNDQQLSGTAELQTKTKSSFLTWNEWPPFRAVICMYELESKGLLQQPLVVGYKTPLIHDDIAGVMSHFVELPVTRVQSVSYEKAEDAILMHTCLLVQDAVRDHYNNSEATSSIEPEEEDAVDLMMRLASALEPSRASTLYEMAALQYGRVDALVKCIELLFDFGEATEDCYRGLDILKSFVATMLSTTAVSVEVSEEDKVKFRNYVLPACEKVLLLEGDKGYVYGPLVDILNAYLICDPQNHHHTVSLAMQQLLFLTQTNRTPLSALCDIAQAISCVESTRCGNENICRILRIEPERFSVENGKTRLGLLELAVRKGTIHWQSRGLSKRILTKQAGYEDIRRSCIASKQQKLAIEELGYMRAIYSLAVLLDFGTKGVKKNAAQAAKLYKRLISQWQDGYAMFHLANLYEKGGEGLKRDITKAVIYYERAIDEGQNVEAMFSLALLWHYGAEGFDSNLEEAVILYEQAIEQGHHVEAMYNLATLLQTGEGGINRDPKAAMALYERVTTSRKHAHAMYNLATLLEETGLETNLGRAAELYESLAEEGDVNAMYALADLLLTERDGIKLDVAKAKLCIRRAVECQSVSIGADHMRNVWKVLKTGSEKVEKDLELCAALEMHAQRSDKKLN